jgi:hypothetical protein
VGVERRQFAPGHDKRKLEKMFDLIAGEAPGIEPSPSPGGSAAAWTEEAAISALKRIPRTPDGPDRSRASAADRALAEQLFREDERYLKNLAKAEVRSQGGAVRHKDRGRRWQYWDRVTFATRGVRAYGVDADWDDIESHLPVWHHEAACRFDPTRGVPWRGWLDQVIPSRVADYLNSGRTAGLGGGKAEHRDTTFEVIEDSGLDHVFVAANNEVREANNPILSEFWFDRKPITQIAKDRGVGKVRR